MPPVGCSHLHSASGGTSMATTGGNGFGFTIPAWTRSPRKQLLSTPRFYLFDLGLRHAAAGLTAGPHTVLSNPGPVFEQWVGLELWKRLRYLGKGGISYLRTKDGAEVDFIVEHGGEVIPIEVKWTENPTSSDARHLRTFIAEQNGYITEQQK